MRTAALTLLSIVAFGYAMNAQKFSLLPQAGFENSKTKIQYNDGACFAPEGVNSSPQLSLRLNYSSKLGHGFFVGGSTSRNIVAFTFADPETGMTNYTTATGNKQFRFEGGYQFSSKPISLGKPRSTASENKSSTGKKNCPFSQKSSCQKKNSNKQSSPGDAPSNNYSVAKSKGPWVKIQPSVGMGFIPGMSSDIVTKSENGQTAYEYRAGNWQTAFTAGTSFEFGCGDNGGFTVSVNYLKGIGNLNTETLTVTDGVKTTTANLQSSVSAWNVRFGIPFNLGKKSSANAKSVKNTSERKPNCQYKYRCSKS